MLLIAFDIIMMCKFVSYGCCYKLQPCNCVVCTGAQHVCPALIELISPRMGSCAIAHSPVSCCAETMRSCKEDLFLQVSAVVLTLGQLLAVGNLSALCAGRYPGAKVGGALGCVCPWMKAAPLSAP
jgi:hypothetical protein